MTKSQLLALVDSLRTDLASANDTIEALRAEIEALTPAREGAESEGTVAPVLSHREYRIRWIAMRGGKSATKADVDAAYAAYLSGDEVSAPVAAPVQFVAQPGVGTVECSACRGTGRYVGVGVTGSCFRCEGKGRQTAADVKRNAFYDLYAARRAARS